MSTQDIEVVHDNFTCGGKLIHASFLFMDGGRVTTCILHDYRPTYVGAPVPATGTAVCNPSDMLNRETGMRIAMRRACDYLSCRAGNKLYKAYRKHLYWPELPELKPQGPIAHYVIVNREVVGVTEEQHAEWYKTLGDGKRGVCHHKNGYGCTRSLGHSGLHVATGGTSVFQVWDNGTELTDAEFLALNKEWTDKETAL